MTSMLCAEEISGHSKLLWLKADEGVELDADGRVALWRDQSGNGMDAGQTEIARRPEHSPSLNSLPAVLFRKEGGVMLETAPVSLPAQYTVFAVIDIKKIQFSVVMSQPARETQDLKSLGLVIASGRDRNLNGVAIRTPAGRADSSWDKTELQWLKAEPSILTFVMDGEATPFSVTYFRNGEPAGASGGKFGASAAESLVIGGTLPSWPSLGGDISELLIYNGALSPKDRQKVEAYLSDRYGISVKQ
jgi:hypothetical protein